MSAMHTLADAWKRISAIADLPEPEFWPRCRAIEQAAIELHPDEAAEISECIDIYAMRVGKPSRVKALS
ncbi:hypothetical protein ACYX7E_14850 [Luteimonas sp. RIT-PG2_3]